MDTSAHRWYYVCFLYLRCHTHGTNGTASAGNEDVVLELVGAGADVNRCVQYPDEGPIT